MKLTDLDPHWVSHGGPGTSHNGVAVPERKYVGISFECPCGCKDRVFVHISNPIDGQGPLRTAANQWQRTGDTFEDLTLHPSIRRVHPGSCKWHGWVKDGEVSTC